MMLYNGVPGGMSHLERQVRPGECFHERRLESGIIARPDQAAIMLVLEVVTVTDGSRLAYNDRAGHGHGL